METWKKINGYECFEVSSFGNVRNTVKQKNSPIFIIFGYPKCNVYNKENRKQKFVHRLVAENFIPNIENKTQVNHINGIKTDNRVENLEWCTAKENINHAFKVLNKQNAKGEKCNLSKLKKINVLFIIKNKGIISQSKLAKIFNVTQPCISNIHNKITWLDLN